MACRSYKVRPRFQDILNIGSSPNYVLWAKRIAHATFHGTIHGRKGQHCPAWMQA